jgi:peptidoglycan hydrolase-like protein with peptidoglycan-binding domain
MKRLAIAAIGALALPLAISLPAAAQQNNAKPNAAQQQQSQAQPMQPNEQPQANLSSGQIRQVQQALDQKGFKAGNADGKLGPETKQALQSFQQSQHLQVTGQPDQQTLAKLGIGGAETTGQAPASQNGGAQMQQPPAPANQQNQHK